MRLLNIIGSRRLGWVLALGLTGMYLWLSFSGDDPMGQWLHMVFHEPLGMALWLGLEANLVLRAVLLVLERLRSTPPSLDTMDNIALVNAGEGFSDWLHEHFGIEHGDERGFVRKGRLSVLPGVVLRVGAAITMTAMLASSHIRTEDTAQLAVLQGASLLGQEVTLSSLYAGLPESYLASGDDSAFSLKRAVATMNIGRHSFTLHAGYPTWTEGAYYRMTDIGFFQQIKVGEGPEATDVGGYLDVLPPGRAVNIFVPSYDAALTLKLAPASTVQKGLITGEIYDLVKPFYEVSVKCGAAEAETVTLRGWQNAVIAGVPLSLGMSSMSMEMQAVRDPALWWFNAGMWLLLTGLVLTPLRIIWYMKEVRIERVDGTVHIGYSEEFFKKWAGVRFETWVRERK